MEKQTRVARILEMAANLAIVVTATLFSIVLVRSYFGPIAESKDRTTPPPITQNLTLQKGDVLNASDVNWLPNGRTLVLALSTTCHFCTESAPFYQKLSKNHGSVRLVAAFPQTTNEGELYLDKFGVKVDEVKQVSFEKLRIAGTPTLVLIDNGGKVTRTWEGALSPERESEVLNALQENIARNQ